MSGFSRGSVAIAVCDRCKMKVPYSSLRPDGDKPGLRVCMGCCDVKDPWRLPRPREKPITLRYPRPDLALTIPPIIPPSFYVAEDGITQYVAEDGTTIITEES